jgi:uncharacterized membrane protein YgdD (TMEM256/DUF423 family)
VKGLARILLRAALVLLPRDRREWGDAILAELEETRGGLESIRWAVGGLKVILLSPCGLARLAALGVVVGVVGGTFGNHEVFLEVRQAGFDSWQPALAFALPSAIAGLLAAWLVLRRHRLAVEAALAFLTLVCVSSAISLANVTPVRPFLDDWQVAMASTDPRAAHHAEELRWNAAIGALGAALVLLLTARRQARRD